MSRNRIAKPVPLVGKKKRLRSLDEFEAPYWLGLFNPKDAGESRLWPIILFGIAIGVALGWLILSEF
jgi:hypothetical protein